MKKLAARRLLLDGWLACLALPGVLYAGTPEDVLIATPAEAHAFADDAPFIFAGQSLTIETALSTERAFFLERTAPIIVAPGVRLDIEGVIASSAPPNGAPLEKLGAGTLVLSGTNVYTSPTALREGTLRVGGDAPLGSSTYALQQHAGTVLQLEPGTSLLNPIQLGAARPGDLPLAGLEDRVEWRVDTGVASVMNNVRALVPLSKTGDGDLHVARTIQSESAVNVQAGVLVLDGAITAPVDIAGGARLEGRGQMAGLRVQQDGIVAPGGRGAVATLTSWGDVIFGPDSVYHVNAHPDGTADRFDLVGPAQAYLDGRVWAEAASGDWEPDHRYTILSADAGMNATRFMGVDSNLAFLDAGLDYDDHRVYLTLRRNDLGVGDVGEIPDDRDVGDVIDPPVADPPVKDPPGKDPPGTGPPGTDPPTDPPVDVPPSTEPPGTEPPAIDPPVIDPPVIDPPPQPEPPPPASPSEAPEPDTVPLRPDPDIPPITADPDPPIPPSRPLTPLQKAMYTMTKDDARSALRQLSGSWHASVRSFLLEDSRYVREAIMQSASDADTDRKATGLSGPHGHAETSGDGAVRSWAHGYVAAGGRDGANGVAGDRHGSRGLVLGLDAAAGRQWRQGGILAAQHSRLERDGVPASATVNSVNTGVYTHGNLKAMRVTAGLLHAWHRIDSRRRVSAGPLEDLLSATYTGRSWQGFIEVASRMRTLREWAGRLRGAHDALRSTEMGPYLRHAWTRLQTPEFHESEGVSAHRVQRAHTAVHATTLGWRVRREFALEGGAMGLEADVGWRHIWGSPRVTSTQAFVMDANGSATSAVAFRSHGQPLARNALALGMALSASPRPDVALSARYSGLYGGNYRDHAAWAELRWAF